MNVAVLMGGDSDEREVSLASGAQVAQALREAGHSVAAVDTARGPLSLEEEAQILENGVGLTPPGGGLTESAAVLARIPELAQAEMIFNALHGGTGEDGTIQAQLDLAGLSYTGAGMLGCALAMDKDVSKRLFRDAGIPTPEWRVGSHDAHTLIAELGLPIIVKPVSGGSSVALTLAHDEAELQRAIEEADRATVPMMYEAFVAGREVTVGIVGGETLPVGEIIPEHELFDYACKYQEGMAREIFPADLPGETAEQLSSVALRVHALLRLSDYSRVDFILSEDGTAHCLEANALPGVTANSLLPKAAAAAGISFSELCDRIVELAMQRASSR